jgi:hypothetical protein
VTFNAAPSFESRRAINFLIFLVVAERLTASRPPARGLVAFGSRPGCMPVTIEAMLGGLVGRLTAAVIAFLARRVFERVHFVAKLPLGWHTDRQLGRASCGG